GSGDGHVRGIRTGTGWSVLTHNGATAPAGQGCPARSQSEADLVAYRPRLAVGERDPQRRALALVRLDRRAPQPRDPAADAQVERVAAARHPPDLDQDRKSVESGRRRD